METLSSSNNSSAIDGNPQKSLRSASLAAEDVFQQLVQRHRTHRPDAPDDILTSAHIDSLFHRRASTSSPHVSTSPTPQSPITDTPTPPTTERRRTLHTRRQSLFRPSQHRPRARNSRASFSAENTSENTPDPSANAAHVAELLQSLHRDAPTDPLALSHSLTQATDTELDKCINTLVNDQTDDLDDISVNTYELVLSERRQSMAMTDMQLPTLHEEIIDLNERRLSPMENDTFLTGYVSPGVVTPTSARSILRGSSPSRPPTQRQADIDEENLLHRGQRSLLSAKKLARTTDRRVTRDLQCAKEITGISSKIGTSLLSGILANSLPPITGTEKSTEETPRQKFDPILERIKRTTPRGSFYCDASICSLTSIPPYITSIISLTKLDLSFNNIKNIGRLLISLTGLKHLDLHQNRIMSCSGMSYLRALTFLDVSENNIHSFGPEDLHGMSALLHLNMSNNEIVSLPLHIGELFSLTKLVIHSNQIAELPTNFFKLQHLAELDIHSNKIKAITADYAMLTKLEKIDLSRNEIAIISEEIRFLSNLCEINLSENALPALPHSLYTLPGLKILNLRKNELALNFQGISTLSALETLDLSRNGIKSLHEDVCYLNTLIDINLASNPLEELPEQFGKLEKLQVLDVRNVQMRGFPTTFHTLTTLTRLEIEGNNFEFGVEDVLKRDGIASLLQFLKRRSSAETNPKLCYVIGNESCYTIAGRLNRIIIQAVDLYGKNQRRGGDSFKAVLVPCSLLRSNRSNRNLTQEPHDSNLGVIRPLSRVNSMNTSSQAIIPAEGLIAKVEDMNNGTYACVFSCEIAGRYMLEITSHDRHISGSPFTTIVEPADSDPRMTTATGLGLHRALVGLPASIVVHSRDRFGNERRTGGDKYSVRVQGALLKEKDLMKVIDNENGTYTISYTILSSRLHRVSVMLSNEHIPGSPFNVRVLPDQGNPYNCEFLHNLSTLKAGEPANFMIISKNGFDERRPFGGEKFAARASSGSFEPFDIPLTDHGDGSYLGQFILVRAGGYVLEVSLKGQPLTGSPVTINVEPGPAVVEYCTTTLENGLVDGQAQKSTSFTVYCNDGYGNRRAPGGDSVVVDILTPEGNSKGDVTDMRDGTYVVKFIVPRAILRSTVNVSINGTLLSGCPFRFKAAVGKAKPGGR